MKDMTQEDKELLLKDLCARLPYKVYCDASKWTDDEPRRLLDVCPFLVKEVLFTDLAGWMSIEYCRPYLRLISSMSEEEEKEFVSFTDTMFRYGKDNDLCCLPLDAISWLNKHHFDYRGLIKKGLALEAPDGMYNLEKE